MPINISIGLRVGSLLIRSPGISLSSNTILENSAPGTLVANISGEGPFVLTNNAGGRFSISGNTLIAGSVSTNFETASSHTISINDTTFVIQVLNQFEQPNLAPLELSSSQVFLGVFNEILILGATAGSSITGTVPEGMTLNSAQRTITGTPVNLGSNEFNLTESLSDSSNSPRVSAVSLSVVEVITLDGLTDVVITNPQNGDQLEYNGTFWENTR
jgi:hypothetical protein